MALHQKGKSVSADTAALPSEFSRHWCKRLAHAMGVPHETARYWTFRRIPDARRAEIASAMIAECDRLRESIENTRQEWLGIAGESSSKTQRDNATDGAAVFVDRRKADRRRPVPG